jgi:hypothetical protein
MYHQTGRPFLICCSIFLLIVSLFILCGMVTIAPVTVCFHLWCVVVRMQTYPLDDANLTACLVESMVLCCVWCVCCVVCAQGMMQEPGEMWFICSQRVRVAAFTSCTVLWANPMAALPTVVIGPYMAAPRTRRAMVLNMGLVAC